MPINPELVRDVFLEAAELPVADRAAYLSQRCGHDVALLEEVKRLLAAHEEPASVLNRPAPGVPTALEPPISERPGTTIGPYKLLEQIGEGGFGIVFMAEQTQPLRRKVALKVLKPGMDIRQIVARFEAERQALALMDHPNIARVFDGGTTPSSRPYFVMELVKGVPITDFCDQNHLAPRQRLELFLSVCSAVQHAHQKGIIHRDLKPSNVLVSRHDSTPTVKVIDFGIAKALGQELTDKTLFTGVAQMVGTPLYMSPEQAGMSNLDVDTRSDVYSLGVLLYELLTGSTPFTNERFKKAAYDEIRRIIREEDPPRPSTRLSESKYKLPSISAQRQTEPAKLTNLVRGELDWIVMKALEKDRNRRYETANGFAFDVQRYLADEPVLACPPSASYRLRKFVRRNQSGLAVAALVLFFLVLFGSGVSWVLRDRSERDEELVRQQRERQAKVAGQVELVLAEIHRLENEQKWSEALEVARRAEAVVAGAEADVETAQRVRQGLKEVEFIDRLERIRIERGSLAGKWSNVTAKDREYTRAFREFGVDIDEFPAKASVDRLKGRSAFAVALAGALDDWAYARRKSLDARGDWERPMAIARGIDPEPLRDRVREAWGANVGDDLLRLADSIDIRAQHPATLYLLCRALVDKALNVDAALRVLREAQCLYPDDFNLNFELGLALWRRNDPEEATRFFTAAVAIRPRSPAACNNLGNCLLDRKKLPEAIDLLRKAIELDPEFALPYFNLGNALKLQEKVGDAIVAYGKAVELDSKFAAAYNNLGTALRDQKKLAEAIVAFRNAAELDANDTFYFNLGLALYDQNKPDEAIESYRKAIKLNPRNATYHNNLGSILRGQKRLDEAIVCYRQAIKLNPKFANAHNNLGNALLKQKNLNGAIAAYRTAIELDPQIANTHYNLGNALYEQKNLNGAIDAYRKAIELDPKDVDAHYNLGIALYEQKNLNGAIDAYRKVIELDPKYSPAYQPLRAALMDQGKLEEARAAWGKFLESDPSDHDAWYGYAELCLFLGNENAYRHNRKALLKRFGGTTNPVVAERTARACLLLPVSGEELEQAVALADLALTLGQSHQYYPFFMAAKGLAEYRLGHFESALDWNKKAGAKGAWVPTHLVNAMAHSELGHTEQSRRSLVEALKTYDWKSSDGIIHPLRHEAEARIVPHLPGFLKGEYQPLDNAERLDLSDLCYHGKHYAAAARLYVAAFSCDSKLAEAMGGFHRYNAACSAALAGCGADADKLNDIERARWRLQSLNWLSADLETRGRRLAQEPDRASDLAKELQHWLADTDFAGVREQLANLPEAERPAWQKLWNDVTDALKQAQKKVGTQEK